MTHTYFCTCPRGLESALADELVELGIASSHSVPGGVEFSGPWTDCYRANLHSRIASRILWRIGQQAYRHEDDLYRFALGIDWQTWFDATATIRVDLTATKSPLRSVEFATLRIKDAVCDRLRRDTGKRPSVDTRQPDVRIFAFVNADTCTLYLDTSGDTLFKRGWRADTGDAPLRENLAAGILRLAGWRPGMALYDPMCGSGTFVVEAAQAVLGIAPGAARRFGFEKLRNFDAQAWASVRATSPQSATPGAAALDLIHASDVSGDAVVLTRSNLERAGIPTDAAQRIASKQIDARHIRPPAPQGILIINPPYGERIGVRGADSAEDFFAEFGNTLKQRFAGWRAFVLTSDMAFQKKIRLAPDKRTPLFNGAIECRLYAFSLVEGSNRK